ncbi:MAG TPA: nucleotide exchange factor GrpE, partial [Alphaproteobacteria bacterium]|nr:nucleotide exchange factor GrpE [Alphaproteobacteria bacterium]
LMEGVEITEKELLFAFKKHGIEKIEPLGKTFDHHFHQAMFEVEDPNQPAGTVVHVLQPGYQLSGRLLRPALVGVAKGKNSDPTLQPTESIPT